MRHFKLENSAGQVLDITTEEILFHEISGLGFEEENDYRQIGDVWWLNHTNYRQATISGNIIFTEKPMTILIDDVEVPIDDPYKKYRYFVDFISKAPLTMMYNPLGPIGSGETYFRTVRVSKLDKTEKNEYGVIDENIEFSCYTPWYTKLIKEIIVDDGSDTQPETITGWIWGGPEGSDLLTYALDDEVDEHGERVPQPIVFPEDYEEADPLVFEPDGIDDMDIPDYSVEPTDENPNPRTIVDVPAYEGSSTPTIFRREAIQNLDLEDYISLVKSPVKLTIYGPIVKPYWVHRVKDADGNYVTVGSGKFTTNVSLSSKDEYVVIDNTGGQYRIYRHNATGSDTDIYSQRDFSLPCFITLREGSNQILVTSEEDGTPADNVKLEAHLYYATV